MIILQVRRAIFRDGSFLGAEALDNRGERAIVDGGERKVAQLGGLVRQQGAARALAKCLVEEIRCVSQNPSQDDEGNRQESASVGGVLQAGQYRRFAKSAAAAGGEPGRF